VAPTQEAAIDQAIKNCQASAGPDRAQYCKLAEQHGNGGGTTIGPFQTNWVIPFDCEGTAEKRAVACLRKIT
jgi:hypothetical protein